MFLNEIISYRVLIDGDMQNFDAGLIYRICKYLENIDVERVRQFVLASSVNIRIKQMSNNPYAKKLAEKAIRFLGNLEYYKSKPDAEKVEIPFVVRWGTPNSVLGNLTTEEKFNVD